MPQHPWALDVGVNQLNFEGLFPILYTSLEILWCSLYAIACPEDWSLFERLATPFCDDAS